MAPTWKILQTRCPETDEILYCVEGPLGRTEWQGLLRFCDRIAGFSSRCPNATVLTAEYSFGPMPSAVANRDRRSARYACLDLQGGAWREGSSLADLLDRCWNEWSITAYPVELTELVNRYKHT